MRPEQQQGLGGTGAGKHLRDEQRRWQRHLDDLYLAPLGVSGAGQDVVGAFRALILRRPQQPIISINDWQI